MWLFYFWWFSPLELTSQIWIIHSNWSPALHRQKHVSHSKNKACHLQRVVTEKVKTSGIFRLEKCHRNIFIYCQFGNRTKIVLYSKFWLAIHLENFIWIHLVWIWPYDCEKIYTFSSFFMSYFILGTSPFKWVGWEKLWWRYCQMSSTVFCLCGLGQVSCCCHVLSMLP